VYLFIFRRMPAFNERPYDSPLSLIFPVPALAVEDLRRGELGQIPRRRHIDIVNLSEFVYVILFFRFFPEPRVFIVKLIHKAALPGGIPPPQEEAVWDFAKGKYSDSPVQFLKDLFPDGWIALLVGLAQPQLPDGGNAGRKSPHEFFQPYLGVRIKLTDDLREFLIPLLG
jgi:hypothetical protein